MNQAIDAGAKGVRVVDSIKTGQELLQRYEIDDVLEDEQFEAVKAM